MIRKIRQLGDTVICDKIKKAFADAQNKFADQKEKIDMKEVLANLSEDPLRCALLDNHSPFEKEVKLSMKRSLGFYFIFLPLVLLGLVALILNIPLYIVFIIVFFEAILLSRRVETLIQRYISLHQLSYN